MGGVGCESTQQFFCVIQQRRIWFRFVAFTVLVKNWFSTFSTKFTSHSNANETGPCLIQLLNFFLIIHYIFCRLIVLIGSPGGGGWNFKLEDQLFFTNSNACPEVAWHDQKASDFLPENKDQIFGD